MIEETALTVLAGIEDFRSDNMAGHGSHPIRIIRRRVITRIGTTAVVPGTRGLAHFTQLRGLINHRPAIDFINDGNAAAILILAIRISGLAIVEPSAVERVPQMIQEQTVVIVGARTRSTGSGSYAGNRDRGRSRGGRCGFNCRGWLRVVLRVLLFEHENVKKKTK